MLSKHKTDVIFITLIILIMAGLSRCITFGESQESHKATLDRGMRFLSDTDNEEATSLAWSPDNKTLAVARQKYSDGGDPPIPEESYIDFLDIEKLSSHTLERTRSMGAFATITGMCWSPKQNQIAFARFDSIWLINLDIEQDPIRLGDGKACAWANDGKMLAIIGNIRAKDGSFQTSEIYILDVSTGAKQDVYSQSNIVNNSIAWMPNSNRLAFVEISKDYEKQTINILDLDSGTRKTPIYSHEIDSPTWSPDGSMLAISINCCVSLKSTYSPKLTIIKTDDGSMLWESSVLETLYSVTWSPNGKTLAYINNQDVYVLDVNTVLKNK